MPRSESVLAFAVLLVVAIGLAAACSSSAPVDTPSASHAAATPGPSGEAAAPSSDPGAAVAARQAIEAVDLADEEAIEAAGDLRFTPAGASAARQVLESSASDDAIWAAIWVYASSGSDPTPLRPFASHADPSIATMAAAALVAFGDRSGFAALEHALADDTQLSGSHPPMTIRDLALSTLRRYVTATDVPSVAADADLRAAWSDWLASNIPSLVFDETSGTWHQP